VQIVKGQNHYQLNKHKQSAPTLSISMQVFNPRIKEWCKKYINLDLGL